MRIKTTPIPIVAKPMSIARPALSSWLHSELGVAIRMQIEDGHIQSDQSACHHGTAFFFVLR